MLDQGQLGLSRGLIVLFSVASKLSVLLGVDDHWCELHQRFTKDTCEAGVPRLVPAVVVRGQDGGETRYSLGVGAECRGPAFELRSSHSATQRAVRTATRRVAHRP